MVLEFIARERRVETKTCHNIEIRFEFVQRQLDENWLQSIILKQLNKSATGNFCETLEMQAPIIRNYIFFERGTNFGFNEDCKKESKANKLKHYRLKQRHFKT